MNLSPGASRKIVSMLFYDKISPSFTVVTVREETCDESQRTSAWEATVIEDKAKFKARWNIILMSVFLVALRYPLRYHKNQLV